MRLDSIQIGSPRPSAGKLFNTTGIHKEPVSSAEITVEGLTDDTVVDTKNHGGPDQAVYVYTRDDYKFWEDELNRSFAGGAFGENLTVSGVRSAEVRTGDKFEFGQVVLEAAAARIPCGVFQEKMGVPGWVRRFREGGRPGIYCRVLSEGGVETGSEGNWVATPARNITVLDTFELYYDRSASVARLEQALESPIAERMRADIMRRLGRLDP